MPEDIGKILTALATSVGHNPWLQASLALVLALILALMVRLLGNLLGRLARKTDTEMDDLLVKSLGQPVFTTIMLIGLGSATVILDLGEAPERITLQVLRTVFVLVWIKFGLSVIRYLLRRASQDKYGSRYVQAATLPLFDNTIRIILALVGLYLILHVWGVDITAWAAAAGIGGLAISLAAKDSLANIFSGVFLLADRSYKVGDVVVLDTGERGQVEHVGLRTTRLLTRDDVEITVPNAVMGNSKIINETGGPQAWFRVRIPVSLAYGADIDHAQAVLLDIATNHPDVCEIPEPRTRFRMFADWSLNFELLVWVSSPELRGRVAHSLNCAIYKRFQEEGIQFPFPKQDLVLFRGHAGPSNPPAPSAGGQNAGPSSSGASS